jgi:DNA-binding response OmpR family regulator
MPIPNAPLAPCQSVLVVDDDPSVRSSLIDLLQEAGCQVWAAADGRQGLHLLQQQPFQLMLLDLQLPEISGWDLLDLAGAHWPLMPVLVLTGFSSQCVPGSLYGADAFLEKPPDPGCLLNTVSLLLNEPAEARLNRRQGSLPTGSSVRHLPQALLKKSLCG